MSFHLPQNGKTFPEEINLAERPCGPPKTASGATGWAALFTWNRKIGFSSNIFNVFGL